MFLECMDDDFNVQGKGATEINTSELQELLLNMENCINHLFGLATLTRRLRPRSQPSGPNLFTPSGNLEDIATVTDKFPKVKLTPWLAERLVKANDQRLQYLAHIQQERRDKERQGSCSPHAFGGQAIDAATAGGTAVPTTFDKASEFQPESSLMLQAPHNRFRYTAATSTGGNREEWACQIPGLPLVDGVQLHYGEPVECPYCRSVQFFTDHVDWKLVCTTKFTFDLYL